MKKDTLTNDQKVAILLNSLGTEALQKIFAHLSDSDLHRVVESLQEIKKAPVGLVKEILEEFYSSLAEDQELLFTQNAPNFLKDLLGEERAKKLWGEHYLQGSTHELESLSLIDNHHLALFLKREHPQTVALIMAHLPGERKKEVLKLLPIEGQVEVILRMSTLDRVAPENLQKIDEKLREEFQGKSFSKGKKKGGVKEVADLLNALDPQTAQRLVQNLEDQDSELGEAIKQKRFVFEDFIFVNDQGIRNLLKEIDHKTLVLALRGAEEALKQKFWKNMSAKLAQMLREDSEALGPQRVQDIDKARGNLLAKSEELKQQGKLEIWKGKESEEIV